MAIAARELRRRRRIGAMSPAEFDRIERCFEAAMDLPPAERSAWLDVELAGSPELRLEVEELIVAASEPDVVARLVESAFDDLESSSFPGEIGSEIGPYRIVRELGRGGMATVYQAVRQEAGFVQTVALKLVRPGMNSDHIVRRFRAERQILANLRHPHIAALFDGGATPDGRPYMVMEFIEGESAIEYVTRRKLPLRKRLELFRRICDAVEYAHQRQVIHRDIKPGNVLVTSDGAPKLLDFGIAKVLMSEMAPDAPETGLQMRLMTPDYASPEQMRRQPVTAATDVYALGVLLFEMLTERRPFSSSGASLSQIERAVCEEAAPRASRFRPGLPGELEDILAVALQKEPEQRYPSAAALSDDIGRHLDGQPVAARRATFLYRSTKWIGRNPFKAAGALMLTIVFVASLFYVNSAVRRNRVSTAEELLLRARHLLQHDPRTSVASGGIPQNYSESLRLLEEATAIAPAFAPAWLTLSEVAEMASSFDTRESQQLLALADRASARAVELDPTVAHAWEMRAVVRGHQKNEQGALEAFERSVELNPHSPYAVRGYANILHRRGRTEEALAVIDRALDALPDTTNPDPRAVSVRGRAVLLVHRAMLLYQTGRSHEALPALDEAINADGSYRLAYWAAGLVHEAIGDLAAAERDFRTGMRMAPQDSRMIAGLAHVQARSGQKQEALRTEALLTDMQQKGRAVACELAVVRAGFGDIDGAVRRLSELTTGPSVPSCVADPRLEAVRVHPGLQGMLSQ